MINPILASSGVRRMRSVRTPLIVTLYVLLQLAFIYVYSFEAYGRATFTLQQLRRNVDGYVFLLALQFALLVLVAPAMTAGSIAGERERQTLDLLKVTNTSSFSIVIGKLLESFGFLCLLIIASMPVLGIILLTGGVSLPQILLSVAFLMLIALAALSIGLFTSTLFKRTVTATVVSYLTIFGFGILTLLPILGDVRVIGKIYTEAVNANITLQSIDYIPISFVTNPGLGLLSLIISQVGLEVNYLSALSYTLYATFELLSFSAYALYNMIFLGGFSLLLIGASALLVRWRGGDGKKRKRKKA